MTRFVALVRGINVGGHNRVAMADLRKLGEKLGFTDVTTLLQSGNMVFGSAARDTAELERRLEQAAGKALGLKEPTFFVRSADEWAAIVKANPFRAEALRDPALVVVVLLKEAPPKTAVAALRAAIPGREKVEARGREAYFFYPDGMGRSPLTPAIVGKHLPGHGTARNWNTTLKLLALVGGE